MQKFDIRAYEGNEPFVFISYAHKDSDEVLPVIAQLQQRGYRVWYDEGIVPGSEWPENIAQHLNDCATVIAFLSPNSMDSANCRREITYALSKNKPFLGVFLAETKMSPGMELQIASQQCVMKYGYPDEGLFYEKVCSCPDLVPCKGDAPAAAPAAAPQYAPQYAPAASAQPAQTGATARRLTIQRQKSFVASMAAMKVYMEDPINGDLDINGTRCRKLGNIKNGATVTFQVPTNAAKVYVIGDKLSRNFCNDYYPLPAGSEDVVLSGKCQYNPGAGNPFRFDGVTDEAVLKNRKKGNRFGLILIAAAVVIGLIIGFAGGDPNPQTFTYSGMEITLTDEFERVTVSGYDVAMESSDVAVLALKESFADYPVLEGYTLEQYADLVQQANNHQHYSTTWKSGFLYYEYQAKGEDGEMYHYFVTMHKGTDAFWLIQFFTAQEDMIENREDIFEWAASVEFEE